LKRVRRSLQVHRHGAGMHQCLAAVVEAIEPDTQPRAVAVQRFSGPVKPQGFAALRDGPVCVIAPARVLADETQRLAQAVAVMKLEHALVSTRDTPSVDDIPGIKGMRS